MLSPAFDVTGFVFDTCEVELSLMLRTGINSTPCICCALSLSYVRLFGAPRTAAHQAPLAMGIFQARILEWVAMPSSRGSSQPRSPALQVDCSLSVYV